MTEHPGTGQARTKGDRRRPAGRRRSQPETAVGCPRGDTKWNWIYVSGVQKRGSKLEM